MGFKPKIFEKIRIEGMGSEGHGLSRINNQVIFVAGAVPGDVADIVTTRRKKGVLFGKIKELKEPSPARSEPFCEHFQICGGCKWQHISYQNQLQYKQQQVTDALERIGKIPIPEPLPIIGSEKTTQFRNKLEFSFSNKKWLSVEEIESGREINRNGLGFHMAGRFDRVVDINRCHLMDDRANQIRNKLRDFALDQELEFFNHPKQQGLLRTLMIRITESNQLMVLVQFGANDPDKIRLVMDFLKVQFPELNSLSYVINTKGNDSFYDLDVVTVAGNPYITESIAGLDFRLSPKSFFQTNTSQAHRLYEVILSLADLKGEEIVFDLYSGTGAIACYIAAKSKIVIGIESVPESVEDARLNAKLNQIDNTRFYPGDLKDTISIVLEKHGNPEVVITDPPRAGMHADVVAKLCEIQAPKIVYVSCNPATQARDLSLMANQYRVIRIQPVDLFPHTPHIENVVLLEKA